MFYLVLCYLLIARVIAMIYIPLNDTTEARYAEIARIMLKTDNWVTPMQTVGVPFWAKPPLATWLSAFFMKCFSVNELAVRMPSLLFSIGILMLVWHVAKKQSGIAVAKTTILVLASSLLFFLDAGAVMTDPALLFCIVLSLVSFWQATVLQSKRWNYWFFAGLGFGLLAKGPIALVLTGMPIVIWTVLQKRIKTTWYDLPWFTGLLLMVLIAAPWYVLAEIRTPGFLNYFIVGEHVHRFLDPGWHGDKYGFAHQSPFGMIWLYTLLGFFPWSIVASIELIRSFKTKLKVCQDNDGWVRFLCICALAPLLFFTFSSNIIYPYALPSIPFLALLLAQLTQKDRNGTYLFFWSSVVGSLFLIATGLFLLKPQWVEHSQYRVVAMVRNKVHNKDFKLIYWAKKLDYSAQYYSNGKALITDNPQQLQTLLTNDTDNYVVINEKYLASLPNQWRSNWTKVASIPVLNIHYIVYKATLAK